MRLLCLLWPHFGDGSGMDRDGSCQRCFGVAAWNLLGMASFSCLEPGWIGDGSGWILGSLQVDTGWRWKACGDNPGWILRGSCVDPAGILRGSCVDPAGMLRGSCVDSGWIRRGSGSGPSWEPGWVLGWARCSASLLQHLVFAPKLRAPKNAKREEAIYGGH